MSLINNTKNQHYISQVEQRLNASNPNAKVENQKIFRFSILDREQHLLTKGNEVKIENSLSMNDLFSFDVINHHERYNFESLFNQYEANIKKYTDSLLKKILVPNANLTEEVSQIFLYKFLNFIRNPFSIKKMINSFPGLHTRCPVDVSDRPNLERIINGRKPHQKHICTDLGISNDDYVRWLKTMFLLTNCYDSGLNFIEHMITEMFVAKDVEVCVGIYQYNNQNCLISDRGFNLLTDSNSVSAYEFNLNKNTFIRYIFMNVHAHAPLGITQDAINRYMSRKKEIKVSVFKNDLALLEAYNKLTVYQAAHNVFCASDSPAGILIN